MPVNLNAGICFLWHQQWRRNHFISGTVGSRVLSLYRSHGRQSTITNRLANDLHQICRRLAEDLTLIPLLLQSTFVINAVKSIFYEVFPLAQSNTKCNKHLMSYQLHEMLMLLNLSNCTSRCQVLLYAKRNFLYANGNWSLKSLNYTFCILITV